MPLFREHREYFYDWCDIGSIYGAPADCLWGGGRVGFGDNRPEEVLALMREYGISARLTFSNSLLQKEHLSDKKCNELCTMFGESREPANGVIVHSDLLADYLQEHYPGLYLVSSTTKVLTDFSELTEELKRKEFRYVVPDFRLNKAFDKWDNLSGQQKDKVEFLCNECCFFGCKDRKTATKRSAARVLAKMQNITAVHRMQEKGIVSPKPWKIRALSAPGILQTFICPWAFPNLKSREGDWAVHWYWNFYCIT